MSPTPSRPRLLRVPSSTRPAIWAVTLGGRPCVVKDYRSNGFLYRHLVGRFLVWREAKALRRLRGVSGVPELYGVVAGLVLVMAEVPGRNLENLEKEQPLDRAFFEALTSLVATVHQRGLAHCDLKRAPNVMVDPQGRPHILDWGASISQSEFACPLMGLIFRRFQRDDLNAVTKLKLRHIPEEVGPEERKRYYYRSPGERLLRAARDRLRGLLQKVA